MTRIGCPLCRGRRWDPNSDNLTECPKCGGEGVVEKPGWSRPADPAGRPEGGGGLAAGLGLIPAGLHRVLRPLVPLTTFPLWAAWLVVIGVPLHAAGLSFLWPVAPFFMFVLGIDSSIRLAALFDRVARCPGCGGRCIVEVVPGAPTRPPSDGDQPETLRRYRCLRCRSTREIGYEPPVSSWW